MEKNDADFSLKETLECGQCFRFEKVAENKYTVISGFRVISVEQVDDSIIFSGDDIAFWRSYFDLNRDYSEIKMRLSREDAIMAEAISFAPGIHILNQAFFETLLSFIISQNNNIPRIRGLIHRLSSNYAQEIQKGIFAFPTVGELAGVSEDDFRQLGFGFRARYLVDAIKKVNEGAFDEEALRNYPTPVLREKLMTICGVGHKVADCVMLFSLGKTDVFPADVWIQRVMNVLYSPNGETADLQAEASRRFGMDAGFAQQYLFHYGRMKKIGKEG